MSPVTLIWHGLPSVLLEDVIAAGLRTIPEFELV